MKNWENNWKVGRSEETLKRNIWSKTVDWVMKYYEIRPYKTAWYFQRIKRWTSFQFKIWTWRNWSRIYRSSLQQTYAESKVNRLSKKGEKSRLSY